MMETYITVVLTLWGLLLAAIGGMVILFGLDLLVYLIWRKSLIVSIERFLLDTLGRK